MKDFSLNRCLSKYRNIILQTLAQTETLAKLQRAGDFSPRTARGAHSEGETQVIWMTWDCLHTCRHTCACTRPPKDPQISLLQYRPFWTGLNLDYTSGFGCFEFSRGRHTCQHECIPRVSWGGLGHSEYSRIEKWQATSLLPFYELKKIKNKNQEMSFFRLNAFY